MNVRTFEGETAGHTQNYVQVHGPGQERLTEREEVGITDASNLELLSKNQN